MKNRDAVLGEFQKLPENTLVFTGNLYREKFNESMSETAFAQIIERLCKSGRITRVSKGVYCISKKTRFGNVLPSDADVVSLFSDNNNGIVVGYSLYNSLRITTQVSNKYIVYSSATEEQSKRINNVFIKKYDIDYSEKNKTVIKLLEVLNNYNEIEDLNYKAFLQSTETLIKDFDCLAFDNVQSVIGYPKRTIAFLRALLNYHRIDNNLDKYLSVFSEYNYPEMERIYELAY